MFMRVIKFLHHKDEQNKSIGTINYQLLGYLLVYLILFFCIGMLFYERIVIGLLMSPCGFFLLYFRRKELLEKQKDTLRLQFKDMLYYLSISISAGKSVESAFVDVEKAMRSLYPDGKAQIMFELKRINGQLAMREPLENLLADLAERSGIEDIRCFSDVFVICRKTGGNLVEVVQHASRIIREKIEMQSEIQTMIAAKKMEQRILSITPFAMVLFVKTASADFMGALFGTFSGSMVMTAALLLIGIGYAVSMRIMNIRV